MKTQQNDPQQPSTADALYTFAVFAIIMAAIILHIESNKPPPIEYYYGEKNEIMVYSDRWSEKIPEHNTEGTSVGYRICTDSLNVEKLLVKSDRTESVPFKEFMDTFAHYSHWAQFKSATQDSFTIFFSYRMEKISE